MSTTTTIHGVILWCVAILLLVSGYVLSEQQFLDQLWLSRAGCLIVMLGIWSGFGGLIEERLTHRAMKFKKHMAERRIRRAFGADEEHMKKELDRIQHNYDERRVKMREELGISVGLIEASLLVTGSFFWGFGDLIKFLW